MVRGGGLDPEPDEAGVVVSVQCRGSGRSPRERLAAPRWPGSRPAPWPLWRLPRTGRRRARRPAQQAGSRSSSMNWMACSLAVLWLSSARSVSSPRRFQGARCRRAEPGRDEDEHREADGGRTLVAEAPEVEEDPGHHSSLARRALPMRSRSSCRRSTRRVTTKTRRARPTTGARPSIGTMTIGAGTAGSPSW